FSLIVWTWLAICDAGPMIWLAICDAGPMIMPTMVPMAWARVGMVLATSNETGSPSAMAPLIVTLSLSLASLTTSVSSSLLNSATLSGPKAIQVVPAQ